VTQDECDAAAEASEREYLDDTAREADACAALEGAGPCECGRHVLTLPPCVITINHTGPADELPGSVGEAIARAAAGTADTGDHLRKDAGKVPLDLMPTDALEMVARVIEFGAKKYRRRGWEVGIPYSRVVGPLLRHVFKWMRGEDNDPETGLSHMAHAACNALFICAYIARGQSAALDDRSA
jgi:hypothetical protein